MKSQFLKIAGVKSEKAFYKKYPTEAAFFKAHPEAKKMANGGEQDKGQIKKLQQLSDFGNPPIAQGGGVYSYTENGLPLDPNNPADAARIQQIKAEMATKSAELAGQRSGLNNPQLQNTFGKAVVNPQSLLPYNPSFQMGQLNTQGLTGLGAQQPTDFGKYVAGMGQSKRAAANSYGQMFGNYQTGKDLSTGIPNPLGSADKLKGADIFGKADALGKKAAPYVGYAKDIIGGISMIKQEKNALKQAKQDKALTDVFRQAAFSSPVDIEKRQYIRPEDYIYQPEQMFPSYGVGTNVLAQDGAIIGGNPTEIVNTFAPNTIYSDMGYEPLDDTSRVKAYYHGGNLRQGGAGLTAALNSGGFGDFMTNKGGEDILGNISSRVAGKRGPNAGNKIGGGIGGGIGTAIGGPVGGMIGKFAGNLIGGLFDKTGKKIDTLNQQSDQNVSDIMYSKAGVGLQNQYSSYMEDGGAIDDQHGWVSNSWQPQVITTFGEHKLKDLLQPPNDADMLRAGGHLRSYTPPSAEAMYTGREQFAMGGDLKVHRGEAETMSYNPYLPEGGETIMFRGPSHENGGMPIEYGSSPVEVEGGEPAVKLQDGTSGDSSLVVYGNLINPKTGKKFKRDAEEISKNEAKQNKKIDKASTGLDNLDVNTSFDKLGMDTYNAIITGANMKLKQYAEDKMDLAALQSAINDTAEEHGLVADHLAKGKVVADKSKDGKAKYGTKLPKAAKGADINPAIAQLMELIKKKGYDYNITSTVRPEAKTAQGRDSRHATGEAADVVFPQLGAKAYQAIVNDPEIARFMLENDLTAIDEYDPNTLDATKGTGPHIHFGYDKGTAAADKFRKEATSIYGDPTKEVKYGGVDPNKATYSKKGIQPGMIDYNPIGESPEKIFATEESYKTQWLPKVGQAFDDPNKAKQIIEQIQNYTGPDAEDVKARLAKEPTLEGKIAVARRLGTDMKVGPYHNILNDVINKLEVPPAPTIPPANPPTNTPPVGVPPPRLTPPYEGIINTILPYVRPSNAEPLDKQQLTPEMYSLISNNLEPVFAQKYNPRLLQPYDISLQDQMNANQADFNAVLRATGGDASAASILAGQKYAANSKVLGEQMRINQANKANIYNTNIQTMNDADLRNINILDQQYVRQAQAKSNTKATTLAALQSITDKYAQNKLANRTLATYENLYNYRYDPSFRAQNMNPLAKFNVPTVTTNVPIYDNNGNIVGYQRPDGSIPEGATPPYVAPGSRKTTAAKEEKPKSAVSRNGSIVKALKNL